MSGPELPDVVGFELDDAKTRLGDSFEMTVIEAPRVRGEQTDLMRVVSVRRTPGGEVALVCAREVHDRPEREAE